MNQTMENIRDKAYRNPEFQAQLQTSGQYFAFVEGFRIAHDVLIKDLKTLARGLEIYQSVHGKLTDIITAEKVLAEHYVKYGEE